MSWVEAWLHAFVWTVVLETPVVVWLTRGEDFSTARRVAIAVFANLATHPLVWFVFLPDADPLFGLAGGTRLVLAETWALVIEAAVYFVVFRRLGVLRAFGVSLLANGFSFGVGLLLYHFSIL
jgi:hypothetical protein